MLARGEVPARLPKASSKLRRRRRAACNLSVWRLAGGALLLPSEVWAYVVSGHVETSGGGAVAGAGISFSDSNGEAASTTSAPDGSYSVDLPANTYSVEVTPPEASGLLPQSQPGVVVTANTTLDIVLVDVSPAAYGGVLRDLSGTPIANARLSVSGDGFSYTGSTNASGEFSISASTASTRVRVSCDYYYDCSRFGESGYGEWYNMPSI